MEFQSIFGDISIFAQESEQKGAEILKTFFLERTKKKVFFTNDKENANILFLKGETFLDSDSFQILCEENTLSFYANSLRAFIYAVGIFFRKSIPCSDGLKLIEDISGTYTPLQKIRGHQLGYRTTPNTYDAWDYTQYERYSIELMFFGMNTIEHIPTQGKDQLNPLMKYRPDEFCIQATKLAKELDLDVSLWYPNSEKTDEEAIENRREMFKKLPFVDAYFPPGGDPGNLNALDFLERTKKISPILKEYHPSAKVWPSAQKPHEFPDWGKIFIQEMQKLPKEIDGVVIGPNKAMEIDELRKALPARYPLRFYPDITHNVRCEYPVHFDRNDWHFAYAATLSRESVNPRPREFQTLHRLTRGYVLGSVSYSEGVHDDLNKMLWADMDFYGEIDIRVTLEDYARLFFPSADPELVADAILGLEQNWEGDPALLPSVEDTLEKWQKIGENTPSLYENWRYILYLFRASADAFVRRKRIFELSLIRQAKKALEKSEAGYQKAKEILETPLPSSCTLLREKLELYAKSLFDKIGLQLDVKRYYADGWERGAVLDTIDRPITDREYFLSRFSCFEALPLEERISSMRSIFAHTEPKRDEFYYSLALHELSGAGLTQEGEIYINFIGDNPKYNNGNLPMSCTKVYDNFSLRCKIHGLTDSQSYVLRVVYFSEREENGDLHRVCINGIPIYEGEQFGEKDEAYDKKYLPPFLESAIYSFPASILQNGCGLLEISQSSMGVRICELKIQRKR